MTQANVLAQLGAQSGPTFRNRLINGQMVIDQRNAGASVAITGAGQYVTDRFNGNVYGSGTGRFSLQQTSTAPTGFVNSLKATVTTADASPSANYGYSIQQLIEGYNIADLGFGTANAKTVTLSFWVYSSLTGTFPAILVNGATTRAYGATYTISSANTWTQASITIVGDTTGVWDTTNVAGIVVNFGLGGGSSRTASTGWQAWGAGNPCNVTGCTSVIATNAATFYITGVQLEVGSSATGFEYENYTSLLSKCYRYYVRYFPTAGGTLTKNGIGGVVTATDGQLCFATGAMRTVPTGSFGGSPQIYDYSVNPTITSITAIGISANMVTVDYTASGGGLTVGRACNLRMTNAPTDYVDFSAEL